MIDKYISQVEEIREEFIKEFGYHVKSGKAKTTALTGEISDWWIGRMKSMYEKAREEIRDDVLKVIKESKATFFGEGEPTTQDQMYELKAEIITNVETYFFNPNQ